jgi:formamidopyrimidine-DNA glycosylase
MPELPEVEIVRRNLVAWTGGRIVTKIATSGRHRGVESPFPSILGCRVEAVSRFGKYLFLHLGPRRLVIHLGMSGRLLSHNAETYVAGPHDHVEISIDDGRLVAFQDHRRFGRMFVSQADLSALPPLGPDALHGELTPTRLNEVLSGRRGRLKVALLNQSVIAGIGNMYACEILWSAHLAPDRNLSTLRVADFENLARSISDVLHQAIAAGGATLEDYRGTSGAMGDFDLSFAVYGRHGKACPRCRSPISAETFMGRITYWCRSCQR